LADDKDEDDEEDGEDDEAGEEDDEAGEEDEETRRCCGKTPMTKRTVRRTTQD